MLRSKPSAFGALLLVLACDRGGDARGPSGQAAVSTSARPSATAPEARPSKDEEPAGTLQHDPLRPKPKSSEPTSSGAPFTSGIVEYKPPPTEPALLTDVRAARHSGFDRIVFEFACKGVPGYHLEYIDKPVRKCGSGDATQLLGVGWLEVRFEAANAHTPSGSPTIAQREQKPELQIVKELEQTCDFEAQVTWVLGTSRPNKYRVLKLDDPPRVVVDVKH
jgi:hypothetical protein